MANKDENQTTSVPAEDPKDALIKQLEKQLAAANASKAATEKELAAANASKAATEKELAAANAEKAATEKELEEMKTAKTAGSMASKDPETVVIKLYKDQNIKDDVQVFVNGRQYIIQRGVEVTVPREVFEVLQNQEKMRNHIAAYNEKHAAK